MRIILFFAILASLETFSQSVTVDHVIYLVKNIDSAKLEFKNKGFTLKTGTKHENGITNAHIKFENGTALELLSLYKEPTAPLSKNYFQMLAQGEGLVYIAFSGIELSIASQYLTGLGIAYKTAESRLWNYLSFPEHSSLSSFFIIAYKLDFSENPKFLQHPNGALGIASITIEGDTTVRTFLEMIKSIQVNDNPTSSTMIHHIPSSAPATKIIELELSTNEGQIKVF